MIYERTPIEAQNAPGVFLYACHQPNSNAIVVGIGYESPSALTRKHASSLVIHHWNALGFADDIDGRSDTVLNTHGVGKHFLLEQDGYWLSERESHDLAEMIRRVHFAAFGAGKSLTRIDIDREGRFYYVGLDAKNRRVMVGVGRTTDGISQLGPAARFNVGKDAEESAVRMWRGAQWAFRGPANFGFGAWGPCDADKRLIAKEIVRLSDIANRP